MRDFSLVTKICFSKEKNSRFHCAGICKNNMPTCPPLFQKREKKHPCLSKVESSAPAAGDFILCSLGFKMMKVFLNP